MPDEDTLTPAQRELEAALGALRPAGPAIDRDRLMFRAGRASARRPARIWQVASVVLAAGLAVSLWARPKPGETVRIVRVRPDRPGSESVIPGPAPAARVEDARRPPADNPYARLCDDVIGRGLDALPALARSRRAAPLSVEQLLGLPRARPRRMSILRELGLRPPGEQQ